MSNLPSPSFAQFAFFEILCIIYIEKTGELIYADAKINCNVRKKNRES